MKPAAFDYRAPTARQAALELIAALGDDAKLLAGGQSLVPAMNFRLARPEVLIDLNRIKELDYLVAEDAVLRIGALTRHARLERPVVPGPLGGFLAGVARHIAHVPIRMRGTFAGSLAHADPAAEWCTVALALDAEIVAESMAGRRTIAASDFFQGIFATALGPDELLAEVRLPLLDAGWRTGFAELSRRAGDFALAMAAVALRLEDGRIGEARIALGGVADRPLRVPAAEQILTGAKPSPALIEAAAAQARAAAEPMADIHASAEYRRDLTGVMAKRALAQALGA
jgi:carbon-monoxide dehydrogenase medium subunit